jgi:aminopeptidase
LRFALAVRGGHNVTLDKFARLAVETGLGLKVGQELIVTAPLDSLPLVRRITNEAYKAGASLVTVFYSDEDAITSRFKYANNSSFDVSSGWLFEGMAHAFRSGAARLAIAGENPTLLTKQPSERVGRLNRARSIAYRPALELISNLATNWCIISYATPGWASQVFPNVPVRDAVYKLWDAIFACSRVNVTDPISAWREHNANLHARTAVLNNLNFHAINFRGPGTDLTVGLVEGHIWLGGSKKARNGTVCNPNIPSEEVFTTPHFMRVDGYAKSTKPLAYQGTLISNLYVRFEEGVLVELNATAGLDLLSEMVGTDEGAKRLGEIALVPHSSPIAASGILFYNTLFDENAASHIAFGQAYRNAAGVKEGAGAIEIMERGVNTSSIHTDWMIGSAEIAVDGLNFDGSRKPVMRQGEWVL